MKPEIWYDDIVIGDFIEDLIGDIERDMQSVKTDDPYFKQLSVEKFTLEDLLQKIRTSSEISPIDIVASFVRKLDESIQESRSTNASYTFLIARDAASFVLDSVNADETQPF